jgi:hypothetical protein
LTDTANNNRSLGAVVKPGKRNSVGRRTADWRHCRADVRSDLSEGVKAISGNRGDEKQTHNLDHQFLLLYSHGEKLPGRLWPYREQDHNKNGAGRRANESSSSVRHSITLPHSATLRGRYALSA